MNEPVILHSDIRDVTFGKGVKIISPVNLYGCTIGSGCFIGPFVEIQKGVIIGKRTKVQSHSFICELVKIGENCFIVLGANQGPMTTGGPANGDKSLWKSTNIGNFVSIGSNATILPVSICDHVVIGAGAIVTKDIATPGTYAGNPAKLINRK